mgnify:CR=1
MPTIISSPCVSQLVRVFSPRVAFQRNGRGSAVGFDTLNLQKGEGTGVHSRSHSPIPIWRLPHSLSPVNTHTLTFMYTHVYLLNLPALLQFQPKKKPAEPVVSRNYPQSSTLPSSTQSQWQRLLQDVLTIVHQLAGFLSPIVWWHSEVRMYPTMRPIVCVLPVICFSLFVCVCVRVFCAQILLPSPAAKAFWCPCMECSWPHYSLVKVSAAVLDLSVHLHTLLFDCLGPRTLRI